jgi:hypothetical protein
VRVEARTAREDVLLLEAAELAELLAELDEWLRAEL